jgi:hypothetical protein
VQGVDALQAVEPACRDHVECAPGHDLLGRLEDQSNPASQLARACETRQEQPGARDHGRVHVVTTCVAHTVHGRSIGHVLGVHEGQRVDVRP